MKRRAYSYIRKDIAGVHLARYEMEARGLAKAEGYDLARTIVDGPGGAGMEQLLNLISAPDADAVVILPSLNHIPDTPLDELGEYADVLTEIPRRRWTKHLTELDLAEHERRRTPREVSTDTRDVPAVAALRAEIEQAEKAFRTIADR